MPTDDRNLIESHVERAIIQADAVEVILGVHVEGDQSTDGEITNSDDLGDGVSATSVLTLPRVGPSFTAVKGVVHAPSWNRSMKPEARNALLTAISKARGWFDDLIHGHAASFGDIAQHEGHVERHVRLQAALAFVSPVIVRLIIDGSAPADLTVTGLARGLAHSWSEQVKRLAV